MRYTWSEEQEDNNSNSKQIIMPVHKESPLGRVHRTKNPSQSSALSVDSGVGEDMDDGSNNSNDSPIFAHLLSALPSPSEGRVLYISRHGESMYNLDNRIGGNPSLSPRGFKYAKALGSYINACAIPKLKVSRFTSLCKHQSKCARTIRRYRRRGQKKLLSLV